MPRTLRNTLAVLLVTAATAAAIYTGVEVSSATRGFTGASVAAAGTLTCPRTGCTATSCHATGGQAAPGLGAGTAGYRAQRGWQGEQDDDGIEFD